MGDTMGTIKAIILDTETHALHGNAIEIAHYPLDLSSGVLRFNRKEFFNERFNPGQPIDLGAMAVHNILDEDVANKPLHDTFRLDQDIVYLVGHNIDYDFKTLRRCGITQDFKLIDTLAMAKALLPEAPNHKLATLSYYLTQDKAKVREYLKNAHSALVDVDLTAILLQHLIKKIERCDSIEDLYIFSMKCRVPTVMPFGEHKGVQISLLPKKYKLWIATQTKFDPWIKFAIELDAASLARRHHESMKGLIPGTYEDYQFIGSRQPLDTPAMEIYEAVWENSLSRK